jgi:hypothetical protein
MFYVGRVVLMVKNVIELGEEENRIINIVKAKLGLRIRVRL